MYYGTSIHVLEGSIRRELIGSTRKNGQAGYIGIDVGGKICEKSMSSAGRQGRAVPVGRWDGLCWGMEAGAWRLGNLGTSKETAQ